MRPTLTALPFLLASLASPAFGQGGDDCGNPTPISGPGPFPVNTAGATDSPQQSGACPVAHADVWFVWTAASSGWFDLTLCGGASADTVAAVYSGSLCPTQAQLVGCNDDSCGVQSVVSFQTTAGASYMIQLGDYYGGVTWSGTFAIGPAAPCGTNSGPDIIVGDLQDIANYPSQQIGNEVYDAVAFGTYSCNIGTYWCNWFAGNNQHPVIDNNLYKYSVVGGAGRFEQLGMSWLKHGFYALSATLCCTGCQPTDGTHLGVRCSDPYTAGRNGGQAGAGPRWQVNAATGVFTYPPANPGFSGTVARRCRFKTSDIEPTSANVQYFAEAQYVTQDDAAAGNAYNNASYRPLGVSGGGTAWDFSLQSQTSRGSPAIRAWKEIDPAVQVVDVDLPGDGRLVLAWRVTDLGGGTWHYEYALFNLNSDLCVRSFSVPKGTGVSCTNIGFHDVDYHDGDGLNSVDFSGTDWAVGNDPSALAWSTSTYLADPNANALRWGTLYNFRFDADAPPSPGALTLGTFKLPGSVVVTAEFPGQSQAGAYCFGDGTGPVACPCANSGALGNGCANSGNAAGALLVASGTTSPDTLTMASSGELPTAFSILLQGTQDLSSPAVFGDGLRCVGGSLRRLFTTAASGGLVGFPPPGTTISARSAALGDPLVPGSVRGYQVYYRDSNLTFCAAPTGNTWNVSNAQRVTW